MRWFGAALGLAIFSAIATNRTNELFRSHTAAPQALTQGFHQALLASSVFLLAAAFIALHATNTHCEPPADDHNEQRPLSTLEQVDHPTMT